jgi:hypothetical protein
MNEITKLETHFNTVLKPKLKRLALVMNISKYVMSVTVVAFVALIFAILPYITGTIVALGFLYLILTSSYTKKSYKNQVVLPLINLLDKNITFDYDKSNFNKQTILKSNLFEIDNIHSIKQSKYLEYRDEKRTYKMCDVAIEYHYKNSDETDIYIEQGLFFLSPTTVNIEGKTLIIPDIAERIMGHTGTLMQRKNYNDLKQIRLDSLEFEKKYIVYGSDEITAHYLLNHTVMEVFSNIETQYKLTPRICFTSKHIYIFMPLGSGWLEPEIDIRKNMLESFDSIKKHFDMIFGLVEMVKKIEKHHLSS